MKDAAKGRLVELLVKWAILGVVILTWRFFRWGGIVGLIGIGLFAGGVWFSFHAMDPETSELTTNETTIVLLLMAIGFVIYVVGVRQRRRRTKQQIPAPQTAVAS